MRSLSLVPLLLLPCCTITFPEPIYVNQVDATFKDLNLGNPGESKLLHINAQACAQRLNRIRNDARLTSSLQLTFTSLGGAVGGVSGTLAALEDDSSKAKTATVIAAVGGFVAVAGSFIDQVTGNPAEKLQLRDRGAQSYSVARSYAAEIRRNGYGKQRAEAVSSALYACAEDKIYTPPAIPRAEDVAPAPQAQPQ